MSKERQQMYEKVGERQLVCDGSAWRFSWMQASILLLSICVFCQSAARAVAENETSNAAGYLAEARKLFQEHRYKQADVLLSSLISEHPGEADLRMLHGEVLRESGRITLASEEFAKAAELAPANPYPMIHLAELSLKQLELDLSWSYAQQAVARDPSCLPARITLVNVLLQCEQTGEAERQLRYFPAASKNTFEVQMLWYRLALRKGDYGAANEHLSEAMSASEKSASETGDQLLMEKSELMQTIGDYSAARKHLEKIILKDPDSLTARLKLGRLLESQFHDYRAALEQFNEALRIDPLSAAATAGKERCQTKGRHIALQLTMTLREAWTNFCQANSAQRSEP